MLRRLHLPKDFLEADPLNRIIGAVDIAAVGCKSVGISTGSVGRTEVSNLSLRAVLGECDAGSRQKFPGEN